MEEVEEFDFIDLYDGLEHQGIKKSTLRFIGLNRDEFDRVEKLDKESYEAAVHKLRMKRIKAKENQSKNGPASQAIIPLQFPTMLQEDLAPKLAVNFLFDPLFTQDHRDVGSQEERATKPEPFQIPPASSRVCTPSAGFSHPSSEFHAVQPDDECDQTVSCNYTLTNTTQEESQIFDIPRSSSPFTDSSIISTRSLKRFKLDNSISSDQFRPISSDVQILTSDKVLDF